MEGLAKLVLEDKEDCVVKFTADWCGACKALETVLEKALIGNEINLYHCNIELDNFHKSYCINSLPVVIRFKDGEVLGRVDGAASLSKIKKELQLK